MNWWRTAVGRSAELTRTWTAADLTAYAALVGAEPTTGEVPEPLLAGQFSTLLGVHLPGPGTNYLKQELEFLRPVRPDEAVTARVEVVRVRPAKELVDLCTTGTAADGEVVCRGRALVRRPHGVADR